MSFNTTLPLTMKANDASLITASSTVTQCSCPSPNQNESPCLSTNHLGLILLATSLTINAILLIFTIGMATYIIRTKRTVRLPLDAVKTVGIQLPAHNRPNGGGGGGGGGGRQAVRVKNPAAAENRALAVAMEYAVKVNGLDYAGEDTLRNGKQPTGAYRQVERPARSLTEGSEALQPPTDAASPAVEATGSFAPSPAYQCRAATPQFCASASSGALCPTSLRPPVYAPSGEVASSYSPARGPTSTLSSPAIPLPASPAASRLRTGGQACAWTERRAVATDRGNGDGGEGDKELTLVRSAGSGSSSASGAGVSSGDRGGGGTSIAPRAKGAACTTVLYPDNCRGNAANRLAGKAFDTPTPMASGTTPKAFPRETSRGGPVSCQKSRLRAAAEMRRRSGSLLCERRWSDCDVETNVYIDILPSTPPLHSESSDDPNDDPYDYENAGPINAELQHRRQPAQPRNATHEKGCEVGAAGVKPAVLPPPVSPRRRRRRSLDSAIEDYDYCNENLNVELFRLRRLL